MRRRFEERLGRPYSFASLESLLAGFYNVDLWDLRRSEHEDEVCCRR